MIRVVKLRNKCLLDDLQEIIERHFQHENYLDMAAEHYHAIVAGAQNEMNRRHFVQQLAADIMLGQDVMVQSNLYLRATRPVKTGQEAVGWHRESFYGSPPEACNFWMPVANVTPENALRYIPGSERIPDEDIVTASDDDPTVQRGSAGHKIGLLYAPKRIVSGVDFNRIETMKVPYGEVALFPGALIHGAAANDTGKIRFSVDFRYVAKAHVVENKPHFASGQDLFVPL